MKVYNILFIFAVFMVIIMTTQATAALSYISPNKINTCVNLPQIEFNSTYQNITFVLSPNKTIYNLYSYMTKNGYSYNYSFCNTSEKGKYIVNGCSDISCWNYEFEINENGIYSDSMKTTSYTISIISIFGIAILFFIGFIKIEKLIAKVSFIVLASIFCLVGINIIFDMLVTAGVDSNLVNLFDFISAASYYFYWLGAGILMVSLFLMVYSTWLTKIITGKKVKYGYED